MKIIEIKCGLLAMLLFYLTGCCFIKVEKDIHYSWTNSELHLTLDFVCFLHIFFYNLRAKKCMAFLAAIIGSIKGCICIYNA